jgi:hypothetical protein
MPDKKAVKNLPEAGSRKLTGNAFQVIGIHANQEDGPPFLNSHWILDHTNQQNPACQQKSAFSPSRDLGLDIFPFKGSDPTARLFSRHSSFDPQ